MNKPNLESSSVYGIGVGPGASDLLTLRAHKLLQELPVIAFPAPSEGHSLTLSIAMPYIHKDAKLVALRMPIDSVTPNPDIYQHWKDILLPYLMDGNVGILCEGDPMLYGSFQYIMALLVDDYPIEIVPGISSLGAVAASAKFPLCSYTQPFHILSATDSLCEITSILEKGHACAIFKVGKRFQAIKSILQNCERLQDTVVVSHASWPHQQTACASSFADDAVLPYFSLLLVKAK